MTAVNASISKITHWLELYIHIYLILIQFPGFNNTRFVSHFFVVILFFFYFILLKSNENLFWRITKQQQKMFKSIWNRSVDDNYFKNNEFVNPHQCCDFKNHSFDAVNFLEILRPCAKFPLRPHLKIKKLKFS